STSLVCFLSSLSPHSGGLLALPVPIPKSCLFQHQICFGNQELCLACKFYFRVFSHFFVYVSNCYCVRCVL
ncbi:LOW QUALITY PROTEIN: hypothetical protein TorRG33x02_163080, partial [Trema orientale]